jgi:hypothetical protein
MIAPNPRIGQPKCTDLATPTIAPQAKMPNCCHDFSSSSSALCHFRAEFSRLIRRPERKSGLSWAKNRPPNHAFARAANRLSDALKNTQKTLFIQ